MNRRQPRNITRAMAAAGIFEFLYWDETQCTMLCRVDPNKIEADPRYQREHDERHSDRMARTPILVQAYPICSFDKTGRTGVLNAIDGQHRVQTAIKRGDNSMIVVIGFEMTLEEKAGLFAELNTVKNPNSWVVFKSRLTAGHPDFVKMKEIANQNGLRLMCDDKKYGHLRNSAVIEEAWKCGPVIYEHWIKCCLAYIDTLMHKSWPSQPCAGNISFQRGLLSAIKKHYPDNMALIEHIQNGLMNIENIYHFASCNASGRGSSRVDVPDYVWAIEKIAQDINRKKQIAVA